MLSGLEVYLSIHGLTTVGSIIVFLIRNEHRLTKLETSLDMLRAEHDRYVAQGLHFNHTPPLK